MKLIAMDVGFRATGIAVFERRPPDTWANEPWALVDLRCIETEAPKNKRALRVADMDFERCREMAREIAKCIKDHSAERMVIELPHGGSLHARSMRCMAMASAVVAAVVELTGVLCEVYTPNDTRKAATGATAASKDAVIAAMGKRWPQILELATYVAREACADAAATFLAAERGVLVKL